MASDKTRTIALKHAGEQLSDQAYAALTYEELLTAEEACALMSDMSPRRLARLRSEGKVVAIRVGNGHLYPRYQIDVARRTLDAGTTSTTASLPTESLPWAALERQLGGSALRQPPSRTDLKVLSHD